MKEKMWGEGTPWKTQAAFFNYIRGGIRRGLWLRHPSKIQLLHHKRKRVALGKKTRTNPKGLIWGCQCDICKKDFKQSDVQVDHLKGSNKLKDEDDLKSFLMAMVFVKERDLQIVCKPCHTTKTYSESRGVSFEEAQVQKKAIEIIKSKEDKVFLRGKGIVPASNAKSRREQLVMYLLGEE
jgi:5-methylcytosine-specific restriction endonuclease McrA